MAVLKSILVSLIVVLTILGSARAEVSIQPKLILISDIDDTLQMTLVRPTSLRDIGRFLADLFKSHDSFVGLATIYNFLSAKGVEIHYVSGATEKIRSIPDKFLQTSSFPVDHLWLRPNLKVTTKDFKVQKIKEIIESNPNAFYIFVGDNGEMDTLVYNEVRNIYPEKVVATFIHKLYAFGSKGPGKPLEEAQLSYISGAEIALHLKSLGLLSSLETKVVLRQVSAAIKGTHRTVRHRVLPRFAKISQSDADNLRSLKAHEDQDPELQSLLEDVIQAMQNRVASAEGNKSCLSVLVNGGN